MAPGKERVKKWAKIRDFGPGEGKNKKWAKIRDFGSGERKRQKWAELRGFGLGHPPGHVAWPCVIDPRVNPCH